MFKKLIALALLALFSCEPAFAQTAIGQPVALSQSAATEGTHVFKATGGVVYSLTVSNSSTAGWLMLFNSATAPADGTVAPVYCMYVPANQSLRLPFDYPVALSTGIAVAYSSTGCFTKTASATAFFSAQIQ